MPTCIRPSLFRAARQSNSTRARTYSTPGVGKVSSQSTWSTSTRFNSALLGDEVQESVLSGVRCRCLADNDVRVAGEDECDRVFPHGCAFSYRISIPLMSISLCISCSNNRIPVMKFSRDALGEFGPTFRASSFWILDWIDKILRPLFGRIC